MPHTGALVRSPLAVLAVVLVGLTPAVAGAPPAAASHPEVRVRIEARDLAGAGVAGVAYTLASSRESVTVTTDRWGNATAKLDVGEDDEVTAGSTDPRISRGADATFPGVSDGDRLTVAADLAIAEGFELVEQHWDLDGDAVPDDLWHQARLDASDRWLIDSASRGYDARQVRFAPYEVVDIRVVDHASAPGNEVLAIELTPDGVHRGWLYSASADDEERIRLGTLPGFEAFEVDLDGDDLDDLAFFGSSPDGGHGFAVLLSTGGDVLRFRMGDAGGHLFETASDVDGDGLPDLTVGSAIPGITTRWWVWQSSTRSVEVVDVGEHGGTIGAEGFADGDGDGLPEFVAWYDVPGDDRGWEVYEYASGAYFTVVLGPEFDRGPIPEHYPQEWFGR